MSPIETKPGLLDSVNARLDLVEQHLHNAADQIQQLLQLYQECSKESARALRSVAKMKARFDNQFPERWNCPHCSRIVSKPADPNEPYICPVCGKSGFPVRGA